jgi:carbonic anhydrase
MNRRELIGFLGAFGASLTNSVDAAEWGYIGEQSPDHWADLAPEYSACQVGNAQAPINLDQGIKSELAIAISYKAVPLKILNNGHTIQVNYDSGSSVSINEQVFDLLQFHFHHPSEHMVAGKAMDMELHLVHKNKAGNLAVVGVFLKQGQFNPVIQKIWDAMPATLSSEQTIDRTIINANQLLPVKQGFYEYFGSLTTPPCSEGVTWIVMMEPIEISSAQLQQFAKLFPLNARPVQPKNQRFVLRSN